MLQQIPEVKLHNYFFRNNADLSFSDQSEKWGFNQASFSNGAVYADLDNDGDLDIVINNINDIASIYQNKQRELSPEKSNFISNFYPKSLRICAVDFLILKSIFRLNQRLL